MSGSIPIQIRGTPGTGPPVGLQERQLAVEMNNGNLWCGVPVSIDSTGRVLLNPRRLPAGGTQYQGIIKGTGTAFGWADIGDRGDENTAIGENSFAAFQNGYYNVALGASALAAATEGDSNAAMGRLALGNLTGTGVDNNTAIGSLAGFRYGPGIGIALTSSANSTYLGYNARAASNDSSNEIVIGAQAIGGGSNTASIGHWTGPAMMTQLWCGGRDLLRIGEASGFADGTLYGLPNDDSVQDICTSTIPAGLWMIIVNVTMSTSTATPWIHYEMGLNLATGQTAIYESAQFRTVSSVIYQAQFSHVCFLMPVASQQIVGSVRAQNATNNGTYDCALSLQPVRLM